MLDRNRRIKNAPQRFQDYTKTYDVIFSCEERCFDAIMEGREESNHGNDAL
jgi:RNA polymerase II subunit A C-terminal domain phosphatase SSU72